MIRWTGTSRQRWTVITLMMSLPALATWALLPKMDYLPDVKRDAVDVWMNFTPGFNLQAQREEVIDTLIARLAPYMKGEREPALKNYYILRYPGGAQIGVRPKEEDQIKVLEKLLMKQLLVGIPDTQVFGGQGSLFGGFDSENGISLLLQGGDLAELYQAARAAMAIVKQDLPGAQVRPQPDLDFTAPELRLVPQDEAPGRGGLGSHPHARHHPDLRRRAAGRRVFRRGGAARHHADGADLGQPGRAQGGAAGDPVRAHRAARRAAAGGARHGAGQHLSGRRPAQHQPADPRPRRG